MNENGQPPQLDGQQPPQGEAPADNGNGQVPEMNSEAPQGEAPADNGNGQAPEMNGQAPQMGENGQPPQMNGKGPEDGFGFIEFKNFVVGELIDHFKSETFLPSFTEDIFHLRIQGVQR